VHLKLVMVLELKHPPHPQIAIHIKHMGK